MLLIGTLAAIIAVALGVAPALVRLGLRHAQDCAHHQQEPVANLHDSLLETTLAAG
jgi:hypothetical protein